MDYLYSLKKGSKHERCPNCGQKTFKPFVDKAGNPAGREFGRCERVNSCQYIKYPKSGKLYNPMQVTEEFKPSPQIDYISADIVEKTFSNFKSNVFFMYLVRLFGFEEAHRLQCDYNIGTATGNGTIFWQQDNEQKFRTGKVIYYLPTGRRDKDRYSWFVHKKINDDFNYQQCFFGLHLATKDKPVALCESEKTAILMSVYKPEFTWVASGGSEMLNAKRLEELPRLDYVFADHGQFEKWERKTRFFKDRQMDLSVENAVKNGIIQPGSDIFDLYLTIEQNKTA